MTSRGVQLELLTNRFNLSLVAYIAVKRMPDRIKLCKLERQTFHLVYLDVSNTQALWEGEGGGFSPFFKSCSAHRLLQPRRGALSEEVSDGRTISHHRLIQMFKWFSSFLCLMGQMKGGMAGARGLTEKSLVDLQVFL